MYDSNLEILLVEDNPNDVELTLLAFQEAHIINQVQVVRDGVEALEFLFCTGRYVDRRIGDRPRVILLDLKLPKVDGLQVLRRLKNDPQTRTIPVVILTSSREDPDIQECYRLGANSYIVKPVDFLQFSEAIQELGFYWLLLNQPARF